MAAESPAASFREAFARRHRIPPEVFERAAFVRCLPPWHRPLAAILVRVAPGWFAMDFEVLRDVARATSLDEVRVLAGDFRSGIRHRPSFLRDWLGIRASGRRMMAQAQQVMPAHRGAG